MSLGWGIIGCGGIADRRTLPEGLLPSPRSRVLGVMDRTAARAAEVAARHGIARHTADLDSLLALPGLEAVYVASPNHCHRDQVLAAAAAGKQVLVEKPLALTLADAEAMISACRAAGVKLMVGYMMRFHAHHRRLKGLVDAGELGQLLFGRAQLSCWYPPDPRAWRQVPEKGGGGAWMDMGSHCVDLLESWLGPVARVSAFSSTLTHGYPVDDSTTVLCEFASSAQGVVEVNFNLPDAAARNSLELRGTRGVVVADHTIGQDAGGSMTAWLGEQAGYSSAQKRDADPSAKPVLVEPISPYLAEVEHFIDCVEGGLEPLTGGELGLRNLRIVLAAYESARSGRVVEV